MMSFVVLAIGILFSLLLIIRFKINTFIALIFTASLVGVGLGMKLEQIPTSIQNGIGSSLGELAIVFGFGAILGRLVADTGGAYRIAHTLIEKFGKKRVQLAIMVAAFIIGIALFFEVGMVLLIPIVFAIALEASVPLLYLGIPMAAALSVTHGFLPPHPAPTAISGALGANPGTVLVYGLIIAIPAAIIAGPMFTVLARKFAPDAFVIKHALTAFGEQKQFTLSETPSFGISVLISLFPVLMMGITTIYTIIFNDGQPFKKPTGIDAFITMIGNPVAAMIISLVFAMWAMGWHQGRNTKDMMAKNTRSRQHIKHKLSHILSNKSFKVINVKKYPKESYTFGQRIADKVARFGGSWRFIISVVTMMIWSVLNGLHLFHINFDPYPFILLNLFLSMTAALQAPLIMMSQNRSSDYDRLHADNDFHVNLKTEEEMRLLHAKIDRLIQKDNPDLLAVQKLQTKMLGELQQPLIILDKKTIKNKS